MPEIKLPIGTITGPVTTPNTGDEKPAGNTNEEQPKLILGKFKTAEELAKAYQELEKRMGSTPPAPAGTPPAGSEGGATSLTTEEIETYQKEFVSKGDLSAESREKLRKKGIPDALIDGHVKLLRANAEAAQERIMRVVGGPEGYKEVSAWAAANVSRSELEQFNATMRSGDEGAITFALRGMKALYDSANDNGTRPPKTRTMGTGSGSSGATPFRSIAEVQAAMRDPRYRVDPAYRKDVEARIAASGDLIP